jgi:hypothetical protein
VTAGHEPTYRSASPKNILDIPKAPLVISDEPILERGAKIYDPAKDGLNSLPMEYREVREFAAASQTRIL